jgi:hypothetical protein
MKTGRLTVLTDAIAERVPYDERRDRASGVRVIDAKTGASRECLPRHENRVTFDPTAKDRRGNI